MLIISSLISLSSYGQQEFRITENGLAPELSSAAVDDLSQSEFYEKTLNWIETNKEEYKLELVEKIQNQSIQFTSTKWNATHLGEKYYIAEYTINLNFEENSIQFEPTAIRLKLNSKYDMGWNDFNLADGAMYLKKGKVIKKYKAYLNDLMARLNKLNMELSKL